MRWPTAMVIIAAIAALTLLALYRPDVVGWLLLAALAVGFFMLIP